MESLKLRSGAFMCAVALFVNLSAACRADDEVVVDNSGAPHVSDAMFSVAKPWAQGFTIGADPVDLRSVTLWLRSTLVNVQGTVEVSIREDESGHPGAVVETLGTVSTASQNSPVALSVGSTTHPTLAANTTYWVTAFYVLDDAALRWSSTTAATNAGTLGTIPANHMVWGNDGGATWSLLAGKYLRIRVNGNVSGGGESGTVPTLSEWGIIALVLGLALLGVARIRRTQSPAAA